MDVVAKPLGPIPPHHFTVHRDGRVDERILRDLEVIRSAVLNSGHSCEALILIGGFGRGEGSVVFTAEGVVPWNDYDVVAVTSDATSREGLMKLAPELAKRLSLGHVDILVFSRRELASRPVSQHMYDLKHGGFVILGDPDVLGVIPDAPANQIPSSCARTLLVNRLTCPLESVRDAYFRKAPPSGSELLAMEYMAHKVVLCAAEARLLCEGAYDVSYARRAETFARVFAESEEDVRLVRESTRFKLEATSADGSDPAGLWFAARDFYLATFKSCMEVCLARPFPTWPEYAAVHEEGRVRHTLRRWKWRLLDGRRLADVVGSQRKARLEMAELFLIAARRRDGSIDGDLLGRARERLVEHFHGSLDTWEECRSAAVWCDYRFIHPSSP